MEKRVIESMQELGFTASEGKIYLSLLQKPGATGYEVAATSGVPRSAIYNVLKKLEALGLVNASPGKPTKWMPLPTDRLFQLMEGRFTSSLEGLKRSLEKMVSPIDTAFLWQVQGYQPMLDHAQSLIGESKKSICAALWHREAELLSSSLEKAIERGVEVVLFSFTGLPKIGTHFDYGIDEEELEKHWQRKLLLVSDHEWALIGHTETTPDNRGVLTKDSAIVEMAINNLVLDITLYGQREEVDTHAALSVLLERMAPLDELLGQRKN